MKCAVDGNADDACTVSAFAVTDKPLVAEAANVECTSAPTAAPTAAVVKVGNVCYRKKMAKGMCQKKWQDTGGCNGNCVSADQCATLINGFNPKCDGFLRTEAITTASFALAARLSRIPRLHQVVAITTTMFSSLLLARN